MVRLVIAIIFLLSSLLCVIRPPEFHLWYIAIIVTEFPWVTITLSTFLLLWGYKVKKYKREGTIVAFAALLLFLSPVVRASVIAARLPEELEHAFGKKVKTKRPIQRPVPLSLMQSLNPMTFGRTYKKSLEYNKTIRGPQELDVYLPCEKGKHPCLIVVHGGSWSGGDREQLPELNYVMAGSGYVSASIDYRLAPDCHSPAPEEDVLAAMEYLRLHAEEWTIDTNNFVLLGRSAGAQIALSVAYSGRARGLKGVINFYGPADMIWGYQNPANPLVMNSCEVIEKYFGGTYHQLPDLYKACSPIEHITSACVPTLTIHGVIDPLVAYGHSTRLEEKLEQAGVKHYLLSMPWATHGCDYTLNGPGGQLSTYAVEQFVQMVTQ